MANKQLVFSALTLCYIVAVNAFPEGFAPALKCRCIRTSPAPIAPRFIQKMEVLPPGAHCRQTEIIITKKNNAAVCVTPGEKWIEDLIRSLHRKIKQKRATAARISTTLTPSTA